MYTLGSKHAEEAYYNHLEREFEKNFNALPVCPWCGCESLDEDVCEGCGLNMEGKPFFECPYCGKEHRDDQAMCCGEKHIELRCPPCPKCGSHETGQYHHKEDSVPECTYLQCDKCFHQWQHN